MKMVKKITSVNLSIVDITLFTVLAWNNFEIFIKKIIQNDIFLQKKFRKFHMVNSYGLFNNGPTPGKK